MKPGKTALAVAGVFVSLITLDLIARRFVGRAVLKDHSHEISLGADFGLSFFNTVVTPSITGAFIALSKCCCSPLWGGIRREGVNPAQLAAFCILMATAWQLGTALTALTAAKAGSTAPTDDDCPDIDDDCGGGEPNGALYRVLRTTGCMGVFIASAFLTSLACFMNDAIQRLTKAMASDELDQSGRASSPTTTPLLDAGPGAAAPKDLHTGRGPGL